jgi:hypothetical protein
VDKVISSYSVISKLQVNCILKFETGIGSWKTFNVLLSNIVNMVLGNIVCMVLIVDSL